MGRTGPHRYVVGGPIWRWILDRADAGAITLPSRTIVWHPAHADDPRLRAHELAHIRQIDRDGAWRWSFLIVWYLLRYGYHDSPYEIDARAAENDAV
jgi:hypothetical protein